ncbi:MAG: RCC1 domain-containing protein, partial [Gemmatimonadota bacterium]
CWGSDVDGQIGTANDELNNPSPARVSIDDSITAVTAGGLHTCALGSDGGAYCWGDNAHGQIGNGTTADAQPTPAHVEYEGTIVSIAAGELHTCGLEPDGSAYCWGYNALGALGVGSTGGEHYTPAPVTGEITFEAIAAGGGSCGIGDDGSAYCWGVDNHGEVGDGPDTTECSIGEFSHSCRAAPSALDAQLAFVQIDHGASGSGGHACAISSTGDGYCWGINRDGKVGNADPDDTVYESPQRIAGAHEFAGISAGLDHSCAIATSGLTYCWGRNDEGQIGDNSGLTQRQPVLVARQQP